MYVTHRAAKLDHENGNETFYPAYERFLEETDESEGGLRFALRAL
jgi:hypothetical protein